MTKVIFIRAEIEDIKGISVKNIKEEITAALLHVRIINGFKIHNPIQYGNADYIDNKIYDIVYHEVGLVKKL